MGKIRTISVIACFVFTLLGHAQENNFNTRAEKVKVFPNPATNVLNVLGLQNSNKASIIITDTYGNTILEHQWEIKNKALNIPVAHLLKGIHSISIRSKEQTVRKKFYKQ
ncbi:T9SS type A sorting domain-containing protein [Maribacter sp. 2304DJ31-5]|uniref:T9SS type A sorting domain-containing protein n=1 Tax=Maribacter sp. 2304DJ31-5 TaxID=3386273 RepID=UPI0039BD60ED